MIIIIVLKCSFTKIYKVNDVGNSEFNIKLFYQSVLIQLIL